MPPPFVRTNSCIDIVFTLRQQFKKDTFRPNQRDIIEAAIEGKDVYVQAATSFGKSLCFQLPAVVDIGITIVVSPLLSLMIDQVAALQKSGINARSLNSSTPKPERDLILRDLETGHPRTRLLYVTPELCAGSSFRQKLKVVYNQKEIARIAIDEAHCISEWGHDFRKDFRALSWFRKAFPEVPVMCLTATANSRVREDILGTLGINEDPERLRSFIMTAHRENLHIEIRYTKAEEGDRLEDFLEWIRGVYERRRAEPRKSELEAEGERIDNVPGIIYTISRDECEYLATVLRKEGIGAQAFHAKLHPEIKSDIISNWIRNKPGYDIIVATTAFGMGIDKENVRFVVHWRIPKSFEGYYQEVGRAGRDGNASYCFMYYSREDVRKIQRMIPRDSREGGGNFESRARSLEALSRYCENINECRHVQICRYFGEQATPVCDFTCDWHKDSNELKQRMRDGLGTMDEWDCSQPPAGTYDEHV